MTFIPTDDFLLKVARGKVQGMALINKFGHGVVGTNETDIWDGNTNYVYPTAAVTLYLSSSNAGDTSAPIVLEGLDTNGDYQTETKALDGSNSQTQVATANSYARLFRMYYAPTGGGWAGSADLAGDVYASSTNGDTTAGVPQTAADIKSKIIAGENQTLMALYTVPNGFTGFLLDLQFDTESTKILTSRIRVRVFGSSSNTKEKFVATTPDIQEDIRLPAQIPSKADIRATASVAASTGEVSASFDIWLVDNNLVDELSFDATIIT